MRNRNRLWTVLGLTFIALLATNPALTQTPAAQETAKALPKIPGLTTDDPFPHACVDCHVLLPDHDQRLSTLLEAWRQQVPPALLTKAQAAAPEGKELRGKHPGIPSSVWQDVPNACAKCHKADSKVAPPLPRLVHLIHLTGGSENDFLTEFQGQCTYCHKLDAEGNWHVPSGPEKKAP
jgi:hypothetical protein